jgi:diadenosine tetraphosphatase ApaH/serine/threonine PP2A family protein phosphatase
VRFACITDIHSNLEALEAVFAKIDKLRTDKIFCLGDIVGYNADPAFCIERVRQSAAAVVRGNHDKAVSGVMGIEYFNSHAAEAVRWTARTLDAEAMTYLQNLLPGPLDAGDEMLLCHGSPQDEDLYLTSRGVIREGFGVMEEDYAGARIGFFGHTHSPLAIDNEGNMLNTEGAVYLERDRPYLINPGSVGQPRDGDPRAAFGVYDSEDSVFTFYRVAYAVAETQEKIIRAGLPAALAQRLAAGK